MASTLSRFRLPLLIVVGCSVGWHLPAAPLGAQQAGNFFLPAPRTLRQHLNRAETALAEERFGDAVLELGALLTSSDESNEPQDFFLAEPYEAGARTSLKSEAYRLLGSMPAKGRELYELQFGADARVLLDEAVAEADFEKLNEVVRRYFHTQAGYEAMVLLGRLHLDRGQPLAATLCFQRVLEAPHAASTYDPELSVLLATCWLYADRDERAATTLDDLRQRYPEAQLHIGERETVSLPQGPETIGWLKTHFGEAPLSLSTGSTEWLVHRGDAARNAASEGGVPLSTYRWRAPTATDPGDEALIREIQAGFRSQNLPALPNLQPLAVGETVLMRTPERLLAIDFQTGKRIWEYPWWDASYPTVPAVRRPGSRTHEIENRKRQLDERLWRDAAYGQISSDGESVFLLDDLRFAQSRRTDTQWFPRARGIRRQDPQWPKPDNQLVALDLQRQGSLKWVVGGESGMNEPRLAGAFFLGPPLPVLGQLYVLAEMNGEIRLVVLDPQTGRQKWSQPLAHVDMQTVLHNPQRRLAGASPSFADGILVCPTSAGAVVAIDLATRTLLWGFQYEPQMVELNHFGMSNRMSMPQHGETWADASVTIAEGVALLTPLESNKLVALDLLSGKPLWPPLYRQGELSDTQFVAGVYDGHAILVGKHRVAAVRLRDAKPGWKTQVVLDEAQGEMPSGRGFFHDRFYYFPTTAAQLVKIDLALGKIVERVETGQVLGNLIAFRDEIVSQSTDFLATYYQIEPLRERVARRLAESSQDAWALARQGELLIHDGQLPDALVALGRALELKPDDEAVRSMLVDTLLKGLRNDFETHYELALELEKMIERPAQRHQYLRLMASGLHAAGRFEPALKAYLELSDLVRHDENGELQADVPLDEQTKIRLDRWLSARLSQLQQAASPPLRDALAEAISGRWAQAVRGSEREQQQFLQLFGFHPAATAARREVATRLAREERCLEAEQLISQLASQSAEAALDVATAVATTLNDRGRYDVAAAFYQTIRTRWPQVTGSDGRTGYQLWETAVSEGPLREAARTPPELPYGHVIANTSAGASENLFRGMTPIVLRSVSARGKQQLTVAFDGHGTNAIQVRDGYGRQLARVALEDHRGYARFRPEVNHARIHGNLLLVVLADQVVAIDLFRAQRGDSEALLWQDSLSQGVAASPQNDGIVSWSRSNPLDPHNDTISFVKDSSGSPAGDVGPITDHGVYLLKSRTLDCLDPMTGATLWTRENVDRGTDVFGDEEHLFLAARTEREALVVSAQDGSLLGRRAVPDWDHRWFTAGGHVLAWEPEAEGVRLFLLNVWNEREIWSESLPTGSRGTLIGDQSVAVLQPDGQFLVRSLRHAEPEISTRLEAEPELISLHVIPSQDELVVVTNSPAKGEAVEGLTVTEIAGGMPAPLVHGRVYLFDRHSGQAKWQTPAFIDNYGLPLLQPQELPTLWFVRLVSTDESRRSPAQSDHTSVLCLDKRSGRILASLDPIRKRTTSFDIVADLDEATVRLLLPDMTLSLKFTGQPVPPEPPAQTGSASSLLTDSTRSVASAVLGAIGDLLRQQLPNLPQP